MNEQLPQETNPEIGEKDYKQLAIDLNVSPERAAELDSFYDFTQIILDDITSRLARNPNAYDQLEAGLLAAMKAEGITPDSATRSADYRTLMNLMRMAKTRYSRQSNLPDPDLRATLEKIAQKAKGGEKNKPEPSGADRADSRIDTNQ